MNFASDIKGAMRECILKLLWAKDDIVSFLSSNGCTKPDIAVLGNHKELSRAAIVDKMFVHLSQKHDNGLGPFRAMLQALVNWSHFDSFYFDKLKKLNRDEAQRAIDHLKQLQEIRDHKAKEARKTREKREKQAQNPKNTLASLKNTYISLMQGTSSSQKRGYKLETILLELSKLSSLEITAPFRVNGEQIDGAIKYDGENYIVEAKWQDKASANESVYQFSYKVDGKMYGRGLFISVNGFSAHVIHSLVVGKSINTIFIDGGDLILVLEGFITFSEMIDKKVKAAQTKGLIYIDVSTGNSKA